MSFLDLYQGDQDQAARIQPNEGTRLPSGFDENLHAAWSDGLLFSQSIARANSRAAVLGDYVDEIRQKTGNDLSKEFFPDVAGGGQTGATNFDQANERVSKLKADYPDLDLAPLDEDEIDKRAVAKATAAHRTYETLQAGEKTWGGSFGSFAGSAGAAAADPINIVALAIAPETGGASILSAALRWGGLAAVSQAAIEASSDQFKEQVQPGYTESGEPLKNIGEAYLGGAVLGGATKALGNAWTRVKTGQWPTSVRDAGNAIESEANVASSNPLPGVAGEVAHREALTKSIDDILAGKPVDVSRQITPEMAAGFDAYHGTPYSFDKFSTEHIGIGEGAQAYGHGLYFAENEKVAGGYADRLYHTREENPDGSLITDPQSNIYRVKITADKDRFLDWDKPLSEQPENVKAFLASRGIREDRPVVKNGKLVDMTGGDLYREIAGPAADSSGIISNNPVMMAAQHNYERASKILDEAGIPGTQYLDAESRDAGEGTRNFVVFDDKHVQITHKNGKPVNAETRQAVVDQAMGLPPKQPELPLAPETEPMAPKRTVEPGPQPSTQTPDEMQKTLTAPDHQDAIRADIDRERALGDFKVPGVDENGNHVMHSVDKAMDEVDAYKKLANDIQACAAPAQEAAE